MLLPAFVALVGLTCPPLPRHAVLVARRAQSCLAATEDADGADPIRWMQEQGKELQAKLPNGKELREQLLQGPAPLISKAVALDPAIILASPQILAQAIFLAVVLVEALQFGLAAFGAYLVTPLPPSARLAAAVKFAIVSRGATRFFRFLAELSALPQTLSLLFARRRPPRSRGTAPSPNVRAPRV